MYDRELIKGSTSLIILQLLTSGDMYGYQIVKEMGQRSDNTLDVKEGTIYPGLHKLEEKGYITSYWKEQEKGPARKYYAITENGNGLLQDKKKEWNSFVKMMNQMLGRHI
ncbi:MULTISPECIES: PadR family transcriptional regulator [Bacillus]|uniref:PadR family transcriptional regulator n=1 Tax=Bacillus TaxID=1386 RepID=UPI000BB98780|nr:MULTISPECIES: PadR family transcriptional regulator [Bacillus]